MFAANKHLLRFLVVVVALLCTTLARCSTPDEVWAVCAREPTTSNQLPNPDAFAFDALVKALPSSSVSADAADAELCKIAEDIREHPDRLAHLVSSYGSVERSARESSGPMQLRPMDTTEDYRYAWEYVLLRPGSIDFGAVADRAYRALGIIHNFASVPIIIERMDLWIALDLPECDKRLEQERTLGFVASFHDIRALAAILACVDSIKHEKPGLYRGAIGEEPLDIPKFLREIFYGPSLRKNERPWADVLPEVRTNPKYRPLFAGVEPPSSTP